MNSTVESVDSEREDAHECRCRCRDTISQHFHGPVTLNFVGHANNCNFGVNRGSLTQNNDASTTPSGSPTDGYMNRAVYPSAPPVPSSGCAGGGLTQTTFGGDIVSLLNPILDASHTRNMKRSPPNSQCLPGTRKDVMADVRLWADSDRLDTDPHMLWILGYAGCGKSAIAHEVAKEYSRLRRLAACFVFFRGSGDRSTTARFATTVASQIAAAVPGADSVIERTIRKNPGLLSLDTASLSDQFDYLVFQPILAIASHSTPLLIVLDGVDECQDHDGISTLIEDMIDFFHRHPHTPLRILIASRVEDHLHQVLHSSDQVQLLNLAERTSDADIAVALDVAIANAKRGRLLAGHESWPSSEDRQQLVEHIGGSFIFMTTIVRRLFDCNNQDGLTPMQRLPIVLSMSPDFDELYKEIFEPWQHLAHFDNIISTIALAFQPLSVAELSDILSVDTFNVVNVLINLHAIMQIPGDDHTPVTLWHTSLRDYLCTRGRSGPLFADPKHHRRLAYQCISVAAASTNTTVFPSSRYARSHAINHLGKLAESEIMDGNSELFVEELGRAMVQLHAPIFKDRQTALEAACRARHWNLVCGLVCAKVDVNFEFPGAMDGIVVALHAACFYENWDMIYFLLEKGADPNIVSPKKNWSKFHHGTPLAFAASRVDVKLVARLLECGADPNLQGGYFDTALQAACVRGSVEVVNLLLNNGADPNLRGGNWGSALHACTASNSASSSCARALLEHKADPNVRDNVGATPLHDACSRGNIQVVECLFEFKADASIKNDEGQTVLQLVQDGYDYQQRIAKLLLSHGIVE